MITQERTLQHGRVVTLALPDLYELAGGNIDIPNEALLDITDLALYGAAISERKERLQDNKRSLRAAFEIASLCLVSPKLVLRGERDEDDLNTRDLTIADLDMISTFFRTGGSESVSVATDNEPLQDTQPDSTSTPVESNAE